MSASIFAMMQNLFVFGGNQFDDVRELAYPAGSVLSYRWPKSFGRHPRLLKSKALTVDSCCTFAPP
jgi:hypothetical protein